MCCDWLVDCEITALGAEHQGLLKGLLWHKPKRAHQWLRRIGRSCWVGPGLRPLSCTLSEFGVGLAGGRGTAVVATRVPHPSTPRFPTPSQCVSVCRASGFILILASTNEPLSICSRPPLPHKTRHFISTVFGFLRVRIVCLCLSWLYCLFSIFQLSNFLFISCCFLRC